jgi:diacylglycerol diphosphate phosphatase / phosphatidate phosphatase
VVYPELAYPEQDCTVPEWLAAILALSIPILVFVGFKVRTRDPWDLSHAVFGVIWAVLIASLISILIRLFFGGFAPDFLSICQPEHRDPYKSFDEADGFDFGIDLRDGLFEFEDRWGHDLDGKGYQSIMHTSKICTQRNRWKIRRAMMSFPSIHTVLYFSGFGFLFLWLNAKLKVWSDHKASFWKLMLVLLPLFLAIIFSGLLKAQNHNHWYDIVAGVIVGFASAVAVFRLSYGGVFDWKHNHKPMDKNKPMEKKKPGKSSTIDKSGPVITRRAGWGAQSTISDKEDVEASV